jgi:hypothetical protein
VKQEHASGMGAVLGLQLSLQHLQPVVDRVGGALEDRTELFGAQSVGDTSQQSPVQFGQASKNPRNHL